MREVFRVVRPNALDNNGNIAWSPDSRGLFAIVRGAVEGAPRQVWWIPLDVQPRQIDVGAANVAGLGIAVHPDGRQIAFVAGDPVQTELRLRDAARTSPRQ